MVCLLKIRYHSQTNKLNTLLTEYRIIFTLDILFRGWISVHETHTPFYKNKNFQNIRKYQIVLLDKQQGLYAIFLKDFVLSNNPYFPRPDPTSPF